MSDNGKVWLSLDVEFLKELNIIVKLKYSVYISNINLKRDLSSLRPMQIDSLKIVAAKKDVIICLPTGYGKSFIYEVIPAIEEVNVLCMVAVA